MSKDVRKFLRQPRRIHSGYLAEDYDGIGQYVKVTMARSSTSVATARVAAGDFGGGRRFPAGTRVTVVSVRGKLEAFLGNNPQINCDPFSRSIPETPNPQGGDWGLGPLGRWWSPDKYYLDNQRFLLAPYDVPAWGWTEGQQVDANIIYEEYSYDFEEWNTRAWVEDGKGKISYRIVGTSYDVNGGDPTQIIEIKKLPRRVVIDFQTHPTAITCEWQVYFGYEHHNVWNEWIGMYFLKRQAASNVYLLDPFSGHQTSVDPWNFTDVEVFDVDSPSPPLSEIREPHRMIIDFDDLGMSAKVWMTDLEDEPADYMAWQRMPGGWLFVPKEYFKVMYFEIFQFLSLSSGLRTEGNQNMGVVQFDKVCIYY